MKLKILMLALISVFSVQFPSLAMPKKKSYNFTRALEEAKEGNNSTALEFLAKETNENPKNGYAYMYMSILQGEEEQFEDAMKNVNIALKKLPKKEKDLIASAYGIRAHLYALAGDTIRALADFEKSYKLSPDDIDILDSYGQFLYELNRYDESDKIYSRLVHLNPGGVLGYMGLGRNACKNENYDEAIKQYNAALRLYDDYSYGYSFRGESYLKQGKYVEAVDDFIKALTLDNDTKAHYYLNHFPEEQTNLVVTKLKGMAAKNPHDAEWWCYIGQIYTEKKRHAEAIEALKKAYNIDAYLGFLFNISECYQALGDYNNALATLNEIFQQDEDNFRAKVIKADVLGEAGDVDAAIDQWSEIIELIPDEGQAYYRRAFFKDSSGKTDAALEDYEMAIMLIPNHAYAYLGKADMLMRKGMENEALEAYRKVVELDTVPENTSCAMYALLALGQKDKAIDFMNRVIENDTTDCGNYYDAACFYSRIGDLDKSLKNLRTSFEKGFRRFHHVRADDDLEALRQTEDFNLLIEEFERKAKSELTTPSTSGNENPATFERVEIPFTPEGGCASVKCSINELPLNFIFDTGADVVSISQVEANFMLKNGYLKNDDIIGSERFIDANGDISVGTIINLREVDFGGLKLNNVRASVVRNQKAPLLLGQSVLGRIGSIEIDNPGKKLIITHSK